MEAIGNYQYALDRDLVLSHGMKVIGPQHKFVLRYIQNAVESSMSRTTIHYEFETSDGIQKRIADIYPLIDDCWKKYGAIALLHQYRVA